MIIENMYDALEMVNCGFQIIINRDDFEQLKEMYGYNESEKDLIVYGDDILYIKAK